MLGRFQSYPERQALDERIERKLPDVRSRTLSDLNDAERFERSKPGDVRLGRADDAEPVDDLVGDERGVGVPGPPVLVVVVAVTSLDVVGECLRDAPGTRVAISADDAVEVRGAVVYDPATAAPPRP